MKWKEFIKYSEELTEKFDGDANHVEEIVEMKANIRRMNSEFSKEKMDREMPKEKNEEALGIFKELGLEIIEIR